MKRRLDRTNLTIFAVIVVFAVFALWMLVWLKRQFDRERTDTIATIERQFSPSVLGMPDDLDTLRFGDLEQIERTLVRPNAYVRSVVVTKVLADGKERIVLPFYYSVVHGDWRERLRQLERHPLEERGIEYGAIYFEFDNSRLNSVRWAIGALGVLLVAVLALVGRRLWVQEVELTRTTVELEEKKRELVELERLSLAGKLSANIFHDIRKPLLNIRMDLDEIESEGDESAAWRERLRDIRHQVELFFSILHDLNIEKFIRGDLTGSEYVNVNELLNRSCALVRYERRGVEIQTDYDASLPPVLALPYRLIQVFSNIILNAYQAMEGNGRLELSTRTENGSVVVRIADTGPGIEPEHLEHIFEPFFSTRPDAGGSGLGLYICKGIIEEMGGRISVSSRPGEGTVFEIRLPVGGQPQEGKRT